MPRFVFVGEQPGDREGRSGHPFVGPAGRLLERALSDAGIRRETVYITNAVKHFKWIPRGKRRLHQRQSEGEIDACHPWLRAEVRTVKPEVLVCLEVSAARAAFGRPVRLKDYRGQSPSRLWRIGRSSPSTRRPFCGFGMSTVCVSTLGFVADLNKLAV